jgi:MFS family permease
MGWSLHGHPQVNEANRKEEDESRRRDSTEWKPKSNPWLIAATVALAAFMEVLDTSIANVALPHIAGDLGASTSQGTWVLTSYLVSNAIILPVGAGLLETAGIISSIASSIDSLASAELLVRSPSYSTAQLPSHR